MTSMWTIGSVSASTWEPQRCRLEKQLQPHMELLCVAPARHVSADALRSEKVWIGIGKATASESHFVVLFHRLFSCCACIRKYVDAVYCVLPIVQNIRVETDVNRCTFLWRTVVKKYQLTSGAARSRYGDLFIERIKDPTGQVLQTLDSYYADACEHNLLFHEEVKTTHQEIWNYRDCIPLDIANMYTSRHVQTSILQNNLQFLCFTWNVGATLPNTARSLRNVLDVVWNADVVVVGLQEICQLSAMRLVQDGMEVQVWKDWVEKEVTGFNTSMHLLEVSHLVGMLMLVFVHDGLRRDITDIGVGNIGHGVGGIGGNKGAVAVRFSLQDETSVCIINAHMAAGQEGYIDRCKNFQHITTNMRLHDASVEGGGLSEKGVMAFAGSTLGSLGVKAEPLLKEVQDREQSQELLQSRSGLSTVSPPTPAPATASQTSWSVNDHTHVIWLGDTNSRLHWTEKLGGMPIDDAVKLVQESKFGELLALDQLNMMKRDGLAFGEYEEHPIRFLPSYKWRPDSNQMDMRSQKHVPAWCDRVLVRSTSNPPATISKYDVHLDLKQSDHRPVYALIGVPFDGVAPTTEEARHLDEYLDSEAGLPQLLPEPAQIFFEALKPDMSQEAVLRLAFEQSGFQGKCRWRSAVRPAEGGVMSTVTSTASGMVDPGRLDADSKALAHSLTCSPSDGVMDVSGGVEIRITANFIEHVFQRREAEAFLLLRLHFSPGKEATFHVPIRAQLEPSIMRLPLQALAGLGDMSLIDAAAACTGRQRALSSFMPTARKTSMLEELSPSNVEGMLPPKEVLNVLTWIIDQSNQARVGSFKWWPDPLTDSKTRESFNKVLVKVENGAVLDFSPEDVNEGVCVGGTQMILTWLQLLPDPVIGQHTLSLSAMDIPTAVRTMMGLSRGVLICLCAMLVVVMDRHGTCTDATRRCAACLTQLAIGHRSSLRGSTSNAGLHTSASLTSEAEKILEKVMAQLREDGQAFPPLSTLRSYSESFAEDLNAG
mmetsp:Transcript_63132/g.133267  ORF Transcript_63132/g.133267 Transcript_63132/m.133267 type:complete len:996 (-) Transcript_63132:189-3176(-)